MHNAQLRSGLFTHGKNGIYARYAPLFGRDCFVARSVLLAMTSERLFVNAQCTVKAHDNMARNVTPTDTNH
ncbi:MAG: hypothetical protein LBL66_07740 [Clostridiales bacterium]|nr:hypothetical protein [Clostridiales bacterium]